MSGFNRQLDARQAEVNLAVLLQDYVLASSKFATDQAAVTALMREKLFKKPSIYQALSAFDGLTSYAFPVSDPLGLAISTAANGTATVWVFRIGDADEVRLRVVTYDTTDPTAEFVPLLGFALTPQDGQNPIPPSDFCICKASSSSTLPGQDESANTVWLAEDIPCAGNKYLHVFSFDQNGNDLIAKCKAGATAFFSLHLVK